MRIQRPSFLDFLVGSAIGLVLLVSATRVHATQTPPTPTDQVICTNTVSGDKIDPTQVCTQLVNVDPKTYCSSYAESCAESRANAICGDASNFCDGGSSLALAKVKQSCDQAQSLSADLSIICTTEAQTCSNVCPPTPACPNVTVTDKVLRCATVVFRKDGTVKLKRGCLVATDVSTN